MQKDNADNKKTKQNNKKINYLAIQIKKLTII